MTREEAIAIIRKEYLCVDRDCDIERSCGKCDLMMPSKEPILEAYKVAIKALEQEPKWVPVSESLPEKNIKHNTFLVTDSNGNLSISKFYLPLSNSDIDRPYWSGMIDVIAWMPLPEPYKAESEGTDADRG